MDDEALVSITNSDGPGSTPEEPLALVITLEPSVETPGANGKLLCTMSSFESRCCLIKDSDTSGQETLPFYSCLVAIQESRQLPKSQKTQISTGTIFTANHVTARDSYTVQ